MGKIIIEFDSVEEQEDARTAIDGYKRKLAIWDLDQMLRSTVKHGQKFNGTGNASSEEIEVCDKLREQIRSILEGYGLNIEH